MARIRKSLHTSKTQEWRVALYIRLSKEDGNDESLSVANQRKILTDYLQNNWSGEEYALFDTYIDDGLTGTDTNRENFKRMKQDIIDGKINCVMVKSLARAFRNLADQQKFLEEFLPVYKVRFINLGSPFIDTYVNPNAVSGFEVPIRGMFNEQFAAATSEEVRKTFNMKRQRGEFIGSFAPYGYLKHPENKNRFIVDEEAALIVKDVFAWYLYGMDGVALSMNGIAKELNERGVPSPIEYKKQQGLNYRNPNHCFEKNLWSATTVRNILQNRMYTGCMVQGRQRVISYKIHRQERMPEDEWYVVPGMHVAIISEELFEEVQKRLQKDTRAAPGKKTVHLFAGYLKCADCGRALHRKSGKGHIYYYCRLSKQGGNKCMVRISIREDKLMQTVLTVIQSQIRLVEDMEALIAKINAAPTADTRANKLESTLEKREQELKKLIGISDSLYGDYKSDLITKDEYIRLKADYSGKIGALRAATEKLRDELNALKDGQTTEISLFTEFQKHRNIISLNRELIVDLIDGILLHPDGTLEIRFNYADQYQRVIEFLENKHKYLTEEPAVLFSRQKERIN